MNHDSAVELFSRRALIVDDGQWGLYEIASLQMTDDGAKTFEVALPGSTFSTREVTLDEVVALVTPEEIEWVEGSVGAAFSIYEANPSQRAWDMFRVTVRLLV